MKDNFIHVCFILDESGSMCDSVDDVVGGFKTVIEEQKAEAAGDCAISLYKFHGKVTEVYVGKNVNDVEPIVGHKSKWNDWITKPYTDSPVDENIYSPGGSTAMFDGIGTAITNIGKWLSDMPEEERPSKNLIVIMTDGEENSSTDFKASQIKEMIKEQEEKYNWSFIYMGTDITTTEYADSIGIKTQMYGTREDYSDNYSIVNDSAKAFRCADASLSFATMDACINKSIETSNTKYFMKTGIDMSKNNTYGKS